MSWLLLIVGFLAFMALIRGAHALDDLVADRFGYRPFAPSNLAFMLIPHGVLLAAVLGWERAVGLVSGAPGSTSSHVPEALPVLLGALAVGCVLLMLVILMRRTRVWIAVAATLLMCLAASVLLPSVAFRDMAQ